MEQPEDIKKDVKKILKEAKGQEAKSKKKPGLSLLAFAIIFLSLSLLYNFFIKDPFVLSSIDAAPPTPNDSTGKITHPADHAIVSRKIIVKGYTENISPKTPYIWLTVDVSHIGLCWPKLTNIEANKKFRTEVVEKGPNRSIMLSLYAVDQKTHDEILEWFDENKRLEHNAGLTMIPKKFRLDSVLLEVEHLL